MDTQGLIEFRYPGGEVVTGEYAKYASRQLTKGDRLEHDGVSWLMYDREDREGVTVHLFAPAEANATVEGSRARQRKR
jgi:hypothetical protein